MSEEKDPAPAFMSLARRWIADNIPIDTRPQPGLVRRLAAAFEEMYQDGRDDEREGAGYPRPAEKS